MKKLLAILLSVASVICVSFTFTGCGDESAREEPKEKGYLHNLSLAYEQGVIDCYALESIACSYYEWRKFDNPYEGKFISAEELSQETESVIKRLYLEKYSQLDDINKIKVLNYFGTYDKNAVVTLGYGDAVIEDNTGRDMTLDGVIFKDYQYNQLDIWVFHRPDQAPEEKVSGKLCGIEKAYENCLLSVDDLKSISCSCYENYKDLENPYSGLYLRPLQGLSYETKLELRKTFNEQFDQTSTFDEIRIYNYYGTYNGNIVVFISGEGCYFPDGTDKVIGGVTFCKNRWSWIYVYNI